MFTVATNRTSSVSPASKLTGSYAFSTKVMYTCGSMLACAASIVENTRIVFWRVKSKCFIDRQNVGSKPMMYIYAPSFANFSNDVLGILRGNVTPIFAITSRNSPFAHIYLSRHIKYELMYFVSYLLFCVTITFNFHIFIPKAFLLPKRRYVTKLKYTFERWS